MKSYTDLEQSKKLVEILPLESADMYYCYGMNIHMKGWSFNDTPTIIDNSSQIDVHTDISCWSLAALLDVLPRIDIEKEIWSSDKYDYRVKAYIGDGYVGDWYDNPIDACVEMIIKLHELKML